MSRRALGDEAALSESLLVRQTWANATFEALGLPLYRLVWSGTLLSFLAFNMASTAQGVVAFDLTGTNRAVGTVMFGQGLAMFLLVPIGGAVADRFSKRFLIILAQSIIGAVMLAVAILLATDRVNILVLACASFIVGSVFSFNGPTRTALVGEIVPAAKIGNAMALFQVANSSARITGPFLAGMLLAWPLVGSTGTYFIIAALFIVIIATMARVPSRPAQPKRETSVLQDVRSGIAYIAHYPRLLHCVVSFNLVAMLGFSYFVLMPGFAKETLHAGTAGLGALLGFDAVGGLAMGLVVASRANSARAPVYLMLASLGTGIALILLGLAPSFPLAALTIVFVGGGAVGFQTLNNALSIRISDRRYYGRVIGIIFLAWGLQSLISLPIGALADIFGTRAVLCGLGVTLCALTGLLSLWLHLIVRSEALAAAGG